LSRAQHFHTAAFINTLVALLMASHLVSHTKTGTQIEGV